MTMAAPSTSIAALQAQLVQAFGEDVLGSGKEDSMAECLSLSRIYSLDPQDLYYKFEAFALSSLPKEAQRNPTLADFQALRKTLQSSASASSAGADGGVAQTPKRDSLFARDHNSAPRGKVGLGTLFGATPQRSNGHQAGAFQTPLRAATTSKTPTSASNGHDAMQLDAASPQPIRTTYPPWEIKQTLNSSIPSTSASSSSSTSRVRLAQGRDPSSFPSRYMFERRGERGEALDDQLDSITSVLLETYALAEEDVADPSIVSQESVFAVGRICPAVSASAASGVSRLQPVPNGIFLESSKLQGAGQRVPIWFTKDCVIARPPGEAEDADQTGAAELLGLFPGMLVGVKGRNGGGEGFGVEEVLLPPALPQVAEAPSTLLASQYGTDQLDGGPLDIVVASGPFTSDDDLDFKPFHSLMNNVERHRPDALVLIGPFIPINHPKLSTSHLLPSDLFQTHFSSRLNRLSPQAKSHTSIILVPSVGDALSAHAAWPQPAYDKHELGLAKGTRVLPDPAFFSISGIVFGTSSVDVLRDLRAEEVVVRVKGRGAGAGPPEDVIARAVRHVLSQRSFYPIFPPPQPKSKPTSTSTSTETTPEQPLPLSLPHIHLASFASVTPDILLLPSGGLAPFAKVVDGVVVVNSGHMQGSGGSSAPSAGATANAATLSIRPMDKTDLQSAVQAGDQHQECNVWERCRVDLVFCPVE